MHFEKGRGKKKVKVSSMSVTVVSAIGRNYRIH